jgi:hypothetical protein
MRILRKLNVCALVINAMVIPTLYKTRLPRELSYPIGAETLSEHLANVPHFFEFRICFSDVVSGWKSNFQQMLVEKADYEIVTARLWSPFEIFVYPVQRGLKHAAHDALVTCGVPRLRDWIVQRSSRAATTFASCSLVFSPTTRMVHVIQQEHVA